MACDPSLADFGGSRSFYLERGISPGCTESRPYEERAREFFEFQDFCDLLTPSDDDVEVVEDFEPAPTPAPKVRNLQKIPSNLDLDYGTSH